MKCTYKYNNVTYKSYSELVKYLRTQDIEELDQLYSLQDDIVEKAKKLQDKYRDIKQNQNSYILNDEPNLETKNGIKPILDFIDSSKYSRADGTPFFQQFNQQELVQTVRTELEEKGTTQQEIEKIISNMIEKEEITKEDSYLLHLALTSQYIFSTEDESQAFLNYMQSKLPKDSRLNNAKLLLNLYNKLKDSYAGIKETYPNSKNIANLNLVSQIKDSAEKIMGHIDYLIIGEDGTLHLCLYKVSSHNPKYWIDSKKRRFDHQLALLKRMLANNGFDVKNITLHIIPIEINYSDNNQINDIFVHKLDTRSSSSKSGTYTMEPYDNIASKFIEDNSPKRVISNKAIQTAIDNSNTIFTSLNINEDGIDKTAKEWIKKAPSIDTGKTEIIIKYVGDIDHSYDVTINGKTYAIKNPKKKEYNPEIIKLVREHVSELTSNLSYSTNNLKDAIKNSYRLKYNTFSNVKGLTGASERLSAVFDKYFQTIKVDGEEEYIWELLDNLVENNVLIFRNKRTGVIDVISLTAYDIQQKADLSKGTTILGDHLRDTQYVGIPATYGNIAIVTTMNLLNEMYPELGDVTIGNIGVVSAIHKGDYLEYNAGEFNKLYYKDIIDKINKVSLNKIEYKLQDAKFSNVIQNLITEYNRIVGNNTTAYNVGINELIDSENEGKNSKHIRLLQLENIMRSILTIHPEFAEPGKLASTLQSRDTVNRNYASLYSLASEAYLNLSGQTPKMLTEFQETFVNFSTAATVPDENIRIVVDNLQTTYDTISEESLREYEKRFQKQFTVFYDKIGYTAAQNATIGNQTMQYSNFFELDENGKKTMSFKNPYDMQNDLKPEERELLKHILFQMAKIHTHDKFFATSINDPKLPEWIQKHPSYLWVPLKRASKSSSAQNVSSILNKMKNWLQRIFNPKRMLTEVYDNMDTLTREKMGAREADYYDLNCVNPFDLTTYISGGPNYDTLEVVAENRNRLITQHGVDYFETNLQNLMVDFLVQKISTTQLNKFLIYTKALIARLSLTGKFYGNDKVVEKEIKYINDYLKVNVFNTSIMNKEMQVAMAYLQPLKSSVTDLLLGFNVVSGIRDTFQGLKQNFMQSATKINADIDPSNIAKAYEFVTTHCSLDAMHVNLLSRLNLTYRISNTDVGRIAEKLKTSTGGIFNFRDKAYMTLRGPDFLNRMTLFVARCMQDGVWDAFSLDSENNLVYNWKEDKRFSIFASKQKDHPEYKKQKAAYFDRVAAYNREHPDNPIDQLDENNPLPVPYSNDEIKSIRNNGDRIYGSYDKSKKAMVENMSYGQMFLMYFTWLNGTISTYYMKPQENKVGKMMQIQDTDINGNKLYYDEYGNILTLEEGGDKDMPVMKNQPCISYGIIQTLQEVASIWKDDGFDSVKKYINGSPMDKANLRKLGSDLLMSLLFLLLFKGCFGLYQGLDDTYAEYKKDMKNNPVLQNLAIEVLYKGSSRSWDDFQGPLNIVQFFGENMNPPYYSVSTQLFKDGFNTLFGEKTMESFISNSSGLFRSGKDTITAATK